MGQIVRVGAWLAGMLMAMPAWAERVDTWAFFGGQMTSGDWETILTEPGDIEFRDSSLIGLAYGRDWGVRNPRLRLGFEGQALVHFGEQDHLEFNIPATIRWRALDPPIPLSGAAFGLGLSFATDEPEVEIDRKGDTRQILAYWMAEIEFGTPAWAVQPFLRIHHRSDGYFIANTDTGSNAIVLGLRARF